MLPAPLLAALRRKGPGLVRRKRTASRALFVARVEAVAAVHNAQVELDIAADADIAPGVQIEVWDHSQTTVRIGPGVQLRSGVLLSLRGGALDIGAGTQVRRNATLQVEGRLLVGADVVLSTGLTVHCRESVVIGPQTIIGEYSTIVDSAHVRTAPGVPIHHHVEATPVAIGANCWLGAGCIVAHGVTIGDQAMIGGHAVVTKDVPGGWLAVGSPARPIREVSPAS